MPCFMQPPKSRLGGPLGGSSGHLFSEDLCLPDRALEFSSPDWVHKVGSHHPPLRTGNLDEGLSSEGDPGPTLISRDFIFIVTPQPQVSTHSVKQRGTCWVHGLMAVTAALAPGGQRGVSIADGLLSVQHRHKHLPHMTSI